MFLSVKKTIDKILQDGKIYTCSCFYDDHIIHINKIKVLSFGIVLQGFFFTHVMTVCFAIYRCMFLYMEATIRDDWKIFLFLLLIMVNIVTV